MSKRFEIFPLSPKYASAIPFLSSEWVIFLKQRETFIEPKQKEYVETLLRFLSLRHRYNSMQLHSLKIALDSTLIFSKVVHRLHVGANRRVFIGRFQQYHRINLMLS